MDIISALKKFGLTEYEAKAYSALVSIGAGTVTEISQICEVPRSNLYSVLESLNKKGFAEVQRGRPIIFKAISPEKALNQAEKEITDGLKKAKKELLKNLSLKSRGKDIQPTLIWGIKGYNSVIKQFSGMIKRCKKELLINLPDVSLLQPVEKELEEAKKRKVKIKITTQPEGVEKAKKYALVRTREKIHGIDIVSDESEVLIAPEIPVIAAWVNNPEIALHVKDFLELAWKESKIVR